MGDEIAAGLEIDSKQKEEEARQDLRYAVSSPPPGGNTTPAKAPRRSASKANPVRRKSAAAMLGD